MPRIAASSKFFGHGLAEDMELFLGMISVFASTAAALFGLGGGLILISFLPDFLPLIKSSWRKFRFRIPELTVDDNFTRHRVLNPIPSAKTVARIHSRLIDRVPAFAGIELAEAWSGMIDALPDVVPVLDQADALAGLWIATGFSGHGFGIGPAAGKIMAALIQGQRVEHELARFRLARFSDGSKLELGPAI